MGARRGDSNVFDGNTATMNTNSGLRFKQINSTTISSNVSTLNVKSGLRTRETSLCLITVNQLSDNSAWGIRYRASVDDDYDAGIAGNQDPVGDNLVTGNNLGPVRAD